ncbi:Uncharacterised protein [Chlamydia trachomatis]|nr:Uncharacterised protein [Chlamydia trachomatis]
MSTFGVNVGLFFPRRIEATRVESLPKGTLAASMMYHFLSTNSFLIIVV